MLMENLIYGKFLLNAAARFENLVDLEYPEREIGRS